MCFLLAPQWQKDVLRGYMNVLELQDTREQHQKQQQRVLRWKAHIEENIRKCRKTYSISQKRSQAFEI